MKNILTDHPDQEVRAAALRLLDALCMWERATSRHNLLIVKDSIGCGYRSFDGAPVPEDVSDVHLLESFQALYSAENPEEFRPTPSDDSPVESEGKEVLNGLLDAIERMTYEHDGQRVWGMVGGSALVSQMRFAAARAFVASLPERVYGMDTCKVCGLGVANHGEGWPAAKRVIPALADVPEHEFEAKTTIAPAG